MPEQNDTRRKITDHCTVTADYALYDEDGSWLDDSQTSGPMQYQHGAMKILPALEEALRGAVVGEILTVQLTPEQAYGPHRENLVFEAHRSNLPPDVELAPGRQLKSGSHGRQFSLRVVELTERGAIVDGNHPLAGKHLTFHLHVREIRNAPHQVS